MATLSSSLVKKLVSVTNDSSSTATSSGTAYGTVTVSGDKTYVLIDGGTVITPVVAGADARDQDRVIVTVENHTATITSNLTNPASSYTATETEEEITNYLNDDSEDGYLSLVNAYVGTLTAGYITADYIDTYYLSAEYIETNYLTANEITTKYLTAEYIETNYLTANDITTKYLTAEQIQADYITADEIDSLYVKTTTLEADYITAGEIEAQYADIDLANIDTASIANLFVNVGILEDVTITNGYITGRLSGVTIDAGSLTSGTLDAGTIDVINLNCANLTVGTINGQQIASGTISLDNLSSEVTDEIAEALTEAGLAYDEATNAYTLALGKNTAYYQDTEPNGGDYAVNDIWYDTDNGNAMYYWDGSEWVSAVFGLAALDSEISASINQALADAGLAYDEATNAYTIAVGKSTVYYQESEPTGGNYSENDIWYDTSNDYTMYYWNGSEWVIATIGYGALSSEVTGDINEALSVAGLAYDEAADAYTLSMSKNTIYYKDFEPIGDDYTVNDIWYDTSNGFAMYYWNGNEWTSASLGYSALSTDVTDVISSALSTAGLAYDEATNAYTVAVGKSTVYYSANEPDVGYLLDTNGDYILDEENENKIADLGTLAENDIWYDTKDGYAMYYWNGNEWIAGQYGSSAISDGAITANKIAAEAVVAGKIAAGAVTADTIAANAITGSKIAANTITGDNIAANTITGSNIAANTITASNIVAGTITATQIASGTITGDNIAANTITGSNIAAQTITAAKIASGTITATQIASGTITGDNIAANTITGSNIAANTITATQIASETITASEIASGTITGSKIAAYTITGNNIVAGSIVSANIASEAITADNIASGTITGDKIAASAITADKLYIGTGGNLYINYDTFEHITNSTIYYSSSNITSATITTDTSWYGSQCLKLVGTGNAYVYLGNSANSYGCIPVTAGKIYRVSCYVKCTAESKVRVYVVGHTAINTTNSAHTEITGTVGTEWTRIEGSYTAVSTYPYISIRVGVYGTVSGGITDTDSEYILDTSGDTIQDTSGSSSTSASVTAYFDAIQIEIVNSEDQVAGEFTTGGTTLINGGNIITQTITATQIAANTITGDNIAANTITGSNIAANTITATQIASGTITATQIASGTITTDLLAANCVTTAKLKVGTGGNLYTNYDTFEQITDSTIYYVKSSNATVSITSDEAYYGDKCLQITSTGSDAYVYLGNSTNGYGCIRILSGYIYRISCYVKSTSTTTVQLYSVGHTAKNTTNSEHTSVSKSVGTSWTRLELTYTASSTYPYLSVRVDNDTSGTTIYVDAIQIEIIDDASYETSDFSPGGTTIIDGSTIVTSSITADKIDVTNLFSQNITFSGQIYAKGTDTNGDTYEVYILPGTNTNNDFLVVHNITTNTYPFYVRANGTAGFGNWWVTEQKIYGGDSTTGVAVIQAPTSSTTYVFAAGGSSHGSYADCPFRVTKKGKLYAAGAELEDLFAYGDVEFTGDSLTISCETKIQCDVNITGSASLVTNGDFTIEGGGAASDDVDTVFFAGYNTRSGERTGYDVRIGDSGSYPIDRFLCYADDVYFRSSNNTNIYIGTSGANAASLTAYLNTISMYKATTFTMYTTSKDSDGYYGQYTVGNPSYYSSTAVWGNFTVGGGYIYGTVSGSSDERVKTDWIDISKYDAFFDLLEGKGFRYTYESSGKYHLGFGAQSVKKALEACGLTEDDFAGLSLTSFPESSPGYHGYTSEYGLSYTEFIALIVYEVQQLKAKVQSQAAEIEVLQAQLME